jgi:hypothetical protein
MTRDHQKEEEEEDVLELVSLRGVTMEQALRKMMENLEQQTKIEFGGQIMKKQMRIEFEELMTKRGGEQEGKVTQICQPMSKPQEGLFVTKL